jgi:hypothetical protein
MNKVQRFLLTVILVLLYMAGLMLMSGCAHTPAEQAPPQTTGCAPLPVCDVTPKASSTQLEIDLWECVVEYRALYSICYQLQHAPERIH